MVTLEEFRTGQYSIPAEDADDVPSCCFTCVYLMHKEFSVGCRDNFYYFCAYYWPDKLTQTKPCCLVEPS
jgi:hypothetical protein